MSAQDMDSLIIAEFSANIIYGYCQVAAGVMFIYECLITGYEEVEFFWKARWTGATALFVANRYFSLGWYIYNIIGSLAMFAPKSCLALAQSSLVVSVLQYLPWAAAAGLRALGVSRNWPLALFVLVLNVVPFGLEFIAFHYGYSAMWIAGVGCVSFDDESTQMYKAATIAGQTCSIAGDALVILVTWFKLSRGTAGTHGLAYVLLRDGTVYFICFLVIRTLHLVLTLLSLATPFQPTSYVQYFMEPLTGIFVSRFLINLQRASRRATHMDSSIYSSPHGDTDIVFERVVGSLGSTLEYDDEEEDERHEPSAEVSDTLSEHSEKAEIQGERHSVPEVAIGG